MKFPREVWFGSHLSTDGQSPRIVVWNKEEYAELVKLNNGRRNCYTNVYNYEQFTDKIDTWGRTTGVPIQRTVILDRIFLDFDAHDTQLEQAKIDTLDCARVLLDSNILFDIIFSGRGFHIHVYGERANDIRQIQSWFRQWDYETLDDCGVQIGRHRRIVNTMNMASQLYCTALTIEQLENFTIDMAKSRNTTRKTYGEKLVNWPHVELLSVAPKEIAEVRKLGKLPVIPCLYNAVMVQNPSHAARVYLISWWRTLLGGGSTTAKIAIEDQPMVISEIMNELKSIKGLGQTIWLDWNETLTRKYVTGIVKKGYNAPSCSDILIPEGYCIGKCWRFPE